MHKKFLTIAAFLILVCQIGFSQKVTGWVKSPDDPNGLPGVSIMIAGTQQGTITNIDGKFSIDVAERPAVLVFSFVGFEKQEVAVVAGKDVYDVMMVATAKELSEVVVTALGIKRDEKALGYSIQKVSGDDVAKVKEIDVVNALSGKVAGVNIAQANGSVGGGGSRIVIRGESSLIGSNDPLYIIDGIQGAPNDVASDDIESISVLKGAAAAALYGSKAGPGVIIITTKSGKSAKSLQVELNSNVTYQTPLVLPEYQNKFGQGKSGVYSYYDGNNGGLNDDTYLCWGPAFDGLPRAQFTGNDPWVAHPNNVKDYYQLGHIAVNNISLSKGYDKSSYRFSYSNTDQKGITPNTNYKQNRFDLNSTFAATDKFTLNANINYIRSNSDNTSYSDVRFLPRNIDINALKEYWVPGLEGYQQRNYRRSENNPYFVAYEQTSGYVNNRTIVNLSASYDFTKDFMVMGRYASVYTNYDNFSKNAYSSVGNLDGSYSKGMSNGKETTAEFLTSYSHKLFNQTVTAKASFGGTHIKTESDYINSNISDLQFLDVYNLSNRNEAAKVYNGSSEVEMNSLYSFLNFDYKNKIFLDITGRNDWSSTLYKSNNSFFYPSATFSVLINEWVKLPSQISFWKVRASYAEVGNSLPGAYLIGSKQKYYWVDNADGSTSVAVDAVRYDANLKPERKHDKEIGTDIRFFGNRMGFDVTYYNSVTTNQIIKLAVSKASDGARIMNAGQISCKGLEVTANFVPIRIPKGLEWKMQVNWSKDFTVLDDLIDTMPSFNKSLAVNSFLYIEDRVGQRRGTFWGKGYLRAPDGQQLFSYSGDTRQTAERIALGNYNPDWMASIINTFTYKSWTFSCLLDCRYGGDIYNNTQRRLRFDGLAKETEFNNRTGIVPGGVVEDGNGGYRTLTLDDLKNAGLPNGQSGDQYWANMTDEGIPENSIVDGTYVKLRELRLAYDLPSTWFSKAHLKGITIALVGRNLAVWTKVKHIDPETFSYSGGSNDYGGSAKVLGFDNSGLPSVRTFGFNLNLKF